MNRSARRWEMRFRSAADVAEIEGLQTDIMRFVAILGFCLMAIFALIQSLPTVSSPWRDPENAEQIKRLRAALATLEETSQASAERAARDYAELQRDYRAVQAELDQLRGENERLGAAHREALDRSQAPAPAYSPERARPQHAEQDAAPGPLALTAEREPLSLVFESERALEALLRRGAVQLFLTGAGDAGNLRLNPLTGAFDRVSGPQNIWFMDSSTVPLHYKNAARRLVGGARYRWGVALENSIQRSLRQQMGDKETGKLVIQASGVVVYRP